MKKQFFTFLLLIISFYGFTQGKKDNFTLAEKEVVDVIKKMFDAMRQGDSTSLRATFHPSLRMQSSGKNKEGKSFLRTEGSGEGFVKAVGTPHTEVWDERILNYEVRIDDNLATVWTPYEFYLGDKFSHCGVNMFVLFKGEKGWQITHIADTRRKENCK